MDPAAISALVAAAVALISVGTNWRKQRAEARKTQVSAQGEIIDDLREHIHMLKDEFQKNGGLSLRDAVDRIEARQERLLLRMDAMERDLRALKEAA